MQLRYYQTSDGERPFVDWVNLEGQAGAYADRSAARESRGRHSGPCRAGRRRRVGAEDRLGAGIPRLLRTGRPSDGSPPLRPDRIPGRYARNLELLAKAIPVVDQAVVWDNSTEDLPPTVVVEFQNERVTTRAPSLPAWVTKALGPLLGEAKPKKLKPAAPPKPTLRRLR